MPQLGTVVSWDSDKERVGVKLDSGEGFIQVIWTDEQASPCISELSGSSIAVHRLAGDFDRQRPQFAANQPSASSDGVRVDERVCNPTRGGVMDD